MAFDPFGDRETRGYLRNRLATNDTALITRLETHAFAANVLPALDALAGSRSVGYDQVLDTHRRLFSSVYPWAGQDRATLTPDVAIAKGGMSDLFAHPADVRRAAEYGLAMGLDAAKLRVNPGEVFGALAYAHPFLEGNGRTIMTVHADLARRAGFHVDWAPTSKTVFLTALTAMLKVLERLGRPEVTTHGFRSTFKDRATECTLFPLEVSEIALDHTVDDKVDAAYRRGDLFRKRRDLSEAWANFCLGLAPITATYAVS